MSNKKSRSSKYKSDKGTDKSEKEGESTKQKKSYNHGEQPKIVRGREREVHVEIISRRLGGGAAPTPEAYARALEQWQQLPGSVMRPPTDVLPPARESPKNSADVGPASTSNVNDADDEEQ